MALFETISRYLPCGGLAKPCDEQVDSFPRGHFDPAQEGQSPMLMQRLGWTTATATAIISSALLAQANAQEVQDAQGAPAISLYSAGIDNWLSDSRDAGLREALRRLIIDGPSLPPDAEPTASKAIELVLSLLLGDTALQMDLVLPPGPGGSPFAVELQARGVRGFGGASMLRQFEDLARAAGADLGTPDVDAPGMLRIDNGADPAVWYGTNDDALLVGVGLPPLQQRDDFAEAGLPKGAALLAGMRINYESFAPLFAMAAMTQPGLYDILESWGLVGEDPLGVVVAVGATDDTVHMAGHFANYGTHFGHLLPKAGVTASLLRRVPKSACAAECTRIDLGAYLGSLLDAVEATQGAGSQTELAQGYQQFQDMFGVDFRDGLVAPLGDSLTIYMSDETGGNGLASAIALVGLSDAATMIDTVRTLQTSIDRISASEAQGYVRFLPQRIHGCDAAVSMRFPGLPIPVEPTIAVAEGTLVMGLFPQSVAAAVAQFHASDSLLDAGPFRDAGGNAGIGGVQIKYMDQATLAADGYGCMAFIGAAIDNYTRSRRSPQTATPPVLPPYTRLTGDMKAGLFYAKLDGADLVAYGTADRSLMAQCTAGVGCLSAFSPLVVAIAAGAAMAQSADAMPNLSGGEFKSTDFALSHDSSDHVHAAQRESAVSTSRRAARSTRLLTLATAVQLASGDGTRVNSLRDLVRGGWITAGDLQVPGHADARYLLVGGGALQNEDGEPCLIAEPGGLPHGRLCVTREGRIAAVAP